MFKTIENTHPFIKIITFINLTILFFFGNVILTSIFLVVVYIYLTLYNGKKEIIANPNSTLLFIVLSSLFVVLFFKNTNKELIALLIFTVRLSSIILFSIFSVLFFSPNDFIYIFKKIKVNKIYFPFFLACLRFIPTTIRDFKTIVFAQRARGFSLSIKSLFSRTTYLAFTIPYIITLLNRVIITSVSLKIKKFDWAIENKPFTIFDYLLIFVNLIVWLPKM